MNLVNFSSREQAEALALCIRVQCGIVACFYAHGLPEPINEKQSHDTHTSLVFVFFGVSGRINIVL